MHSICQPVVYSRDPSMPPCSSRAPEGGQEESWNLRPEKKVTFLSRILMDLSCSLINFQPVQISMRVNENFRCFGIITLIQNTRLETLNRLSWGGTGAWRRDGTGGGGMVRVAEGWYGWRRDGTGDGGMARVADAVSALCFTTEFQVNSGWTGL